MQIGSVTTPFGRRPMTLALVRRQAKLANIQQGTTADKWKVFRDISVAMDMLCVQSNSLAVLDALLSFYPDNELRQGANLIVFPSNTQLALRAHGMAGATLRRHIAVLVDAGLIVRKDSANGKRYARKDGSGKIESAFGFDLSPLLARCEEIAMMAQKIVADRSALRVARERLTICRRDVRKLISAALEEGADGDWQAIEETYVTLVKRISPAPTLASVTALIKEMEMLQEEVLNRLAFNEKFEIMGTNAAHNEQHIQNSHTKLLNESEPKAPEEPVKQLSVTRSPKSEWLQAFPLGVVLRACPVIADYGPGGAIGNWRDLMSAAAVVRTVLGVSASAYQEACDTMGPVNAAVAMAGILERANFITSAGGYLRDLTRRTERGEFSLGPMIVALLKNQAGRVRQLA
jgi:replication initiation protein RepC